MVSSEKRGSRGDKSLAYFMMMSHRSTSFIGESPSVVSSEKRESREDDDESSFDESRFIR